VDSAPAESGFDFEMDGQPALAAGCVQRRKSSSEQHLIADRDRHALAQRVGREFGRNREEDHDRHVDAGLAQFQRLIERGHP
jgi:hypothetical protein